jgi:hypothetical protein
VPLIRIQKFQFSLLLGLFWQLYTKQAQYDEGCSKLNYLLAEVSIITGFALKRVDHSSDLFDFDDHFTGLG